MRFVEPKSVEQQSRAVLFRSHERLVHQRTQLVNAIRAGLYEYGHVVPLGLANWGVSGKLSISPRAILPVWCGKNVVIA